MNKHNETLMEEYRNAHVQYEELEKQASALLEAELKKRDIMVLQLSHRLKTETSLIGKLEKKGDKYQGIRDITDLLGIRLICYFADDVDRLAEIIEGLFVIDWENSVDKRKKLDDDQFGYMSLHYICSLTPEQCMQEDIRSIRFEIQIRSVLQHAWAEINHDIGYKSTSGVPHSIIRAFSRIAGLLEVADDQFAQIRDNVKNYRQNTAETIRNKDLDKLPINETTLHAYFENDPIVQTCFHDRTLIQDGYEDSAERLSALGIQTIDGLAKMVEQSLAKAMELADYENDGLSKDIYGGQLVRLLIEACLSSNDDPESAVHAYMIQYYGDNDLAKEREKDLLKYIKRMNKGKKPKIKGSDIL